MATIVKNGVYSLQLFPSKDFEYKLFKLKIGETLRFTLSPELVAEEVLLYSDYPSKGRQYKRDNYAVLEWTYRGKQPHWDPDRFIDICIDRAGTFKFYFCRAGENKSAALGQGFFLVDPQLHRPLDSITCQTYITKLLGPLAEWKDRLRVAKESGYNMIHLTPVQHLGSSDSAYSIADQLKLDPRYLGEKYKAKNVTISYKDAMGSQCSFEVDQSFAELKKVIDELKRDWDMHVITDVVWNHTAFDSPWLPDHPDAGYNLVNSPHLRPAYALDVALAQFSQEIAEGKWQNAGISPYISSENDVRIIQTRLLDSVLPKARLWEYFSLDKQAIVDKFRHSVYKKQTVQESPTAVEGDLTIIQDSQYRRLGSYVDANLTMQLFNIDHPCAVCFEDRIERCCLELAAMLEDLNNQLKKKVEQQLAKAVDNLLGYIRYQFYEPNGFKWGRVTKDHPAFPRYFTVIGGGPDLAWSEIEGSKGRYVVAHNGWVMNADPLKNFADPGSQVYFQRELVVWGDSVKLRYGKEPKDNPWLWEHMIRYTKISAWLFQGFRLDNCHNTPIVVAEMLLEVARSVKSNLYVMAELFTGSEGTDNYFVNRLGIHSLVREAMFAPIPFELGRLVYKYGGTPVASFMMPPKLRPTTAHAIFYDVTHDNEPGHILTRSVYDALPNSALVSIASCASGSTRGYDELVPHKIDVVFEKRLYKKWSAEEDFDKGIIRAKAILNDLHQKLAEEGYSEIFVDQVSDDVVAVTRHCPATHESIILVAHTSFKHPPEGAFPTETNPMTSFCNVPNLTVQGETTSYCTYLHIVMCFKRHVFSLIHNYICTYVRTYVGGLFCALIDLP
jgi:glycogen debranching enzyme